MKLVSMPGHQPSGFDEFGNATLKLDSQTTVTGLLAQLRLSDLETYMVLVNGTVIPPSEHGSHVLADGDEAAVFPPMEGG
ncbi:MAG: MoaD/ThiS family protein [Rhodospirillales bacterium]|nr:MoaD/ThiS family protein [Rhodospirillales bacterium]